MTPFATAIHRAARAGLFVAACLFAAGAPALGATPAAAASGVPSGKIGFINTERILKDSLLAKQAQHKLEAEFSQRDANLRAMAARIKALSAKLDKDGPVMSDSERSSAQQKLGDLNREFQRKQREFAEDLNARRNAALAAVLDKANQVVKQVAQQGNYDIIFQQAVYVNPRIDITDKVLKALDAQTPRP